MCVSVIGTGPDINADRDKLTFTQTAGALLILKQHFLHQLTRADSARQSTMSMRRTVVGCVTLVCLVALLAERTEGHITFFSPKEMMVLKEQGVRKFMEPRSEDGQFEEVTVQQLPQDKTDRTVEIAVRLSPKQLDHVVPVLEEIIQEMVEEHQKAAK